jgi:hypothetical protein
MAMSEIGTSRLPLKNDLVSDTVGISVNQLGSGAVYPGFLTALREKIAAFILLYSKTLISLFYFELALTVLAVSAHRSSQHMWQTKAPKLHA